VSRTDAGICSNRWSAIWKAQQSSATYVRLERRDSTQWPVKIPSTQKTKNTMHACVVCKSHKPSVGHRLRKGESRKGSNQDTCVKAATIVQLCVFQTLSYSWEFTGVLCCNMCHCLQQSCQSGGLGVRTPDWRTFQKTDEKIWSVSLTQKTELCQMTLHHKKFSGGSQGGRPWPLPLDHLGALPLDLHVLQVPEC